MKLYERLCEVYEQVFPINTKTVDFISELTPKGQLLIDVACGTGDHIAELAGRGHLVKGADLSKDMISKAKAKHSELSFAELNMQDIAKFSGEKVGAVFCLGNSLVHLSNTDEVLKFFNESYKLLENDGKLIVQIVNYDRIIRDSVNALPTITNENVEFIRDYKISNDKRYVSFDTKLKVDDEIYTSKTNLLTLQREELQDLLGKAGFKNIDFFGGYDKSEWTADSFPTIFVARK